jgi:hypothetical protein
LAREQQIGRAKHKQDPEHLGNEQVRQLEPYGGQQDYVQRTKGKLCQQGCAEEWERLGRLVPMRASEPSTARKRRRLPRQSFHSTLDTRAMAFEERADLICLLVGPTEVISRVMRNFSG